MNKISIGGILLVSTIFLAACTGCGSDKPSTDPDTTPIDAGVETDGSDASVPEADGSGEASPDAEGSDASVPEADGSGVGEDTEEEE